MRQKQKQSLLIFLITAICSGCADHPCPALHQWTPFEQRQLADQLKDLPESSMIPPVIEDYAQLRRSCA